MGAIASLAFSNNTSSKQKHQNLLETPCCAGCKILFDFEKQNTQNLTGALDKLNKNVDDYVKRHGHDERIEQLKNEWKLVALILDRFFFWVFAFITVFSTVLLLIVIPLLKNLNLIRSFRINYHNSIHGFGSY